ncbi:Coiled-coil domain containing 147 [Nesidiocoris tenuis]|uniref:Coiled-coil domain containing 147 n=1 Tax=Nesidiocoris tenuis TaxID=355587 RepID=A0ABN7B0J1_9HEMI|nr:Coiled-coil domain containing 147 [Nesidiocoris tenuis]
MALTGTTNWDDYDDDEEEDEEPVPKSPEYPSRDDFWSQIMNEQEQIAVDYEKAIQELLSLEEPLPNVQSVFTRLHELTQRFKMGVKRKDAEIREKEEKIEQLAHTLEKYKNSITIDQKNEIEQQLVVLQKQLDVSHLREQDLQETVDYMRKQVKSLETTIEQKESEAAELDADLELMGRTREGMQKEKEKMKKIMMQTEAMVSAANAERDEYSRLYDTSKIIIDDLKKQFSEKITEAEQLTKQAVGSERTIDDLKKNYTELVNEYDNLYDMYNDCYKQLNIHRETNQELASGLEELYKENEDLDESEKLLKRKLNILKVRLSANERRYSQLRGDYEAQCDEIEKLAKEVHKFKDGLVKIGVAGPAAASTGDTQPLSAIASAASLAQKRQPKTEQKPEDETVRALEKDIKEREKKIAELDSTINGLQAEKRVMAESMAKVVGLNTDLQGQLKSQNAALKSMDQFLTDARQQLRELRNQCEMLKHEKKKVVKEKETLQTKSNDLLDMNRQYEEQLIATKRELMEKTAQLKKERNNLEVAKAERNSEHAKWQETYAMLQDQKRNTKIEATQIHQLKEEVAAREKKLTKEQLAMKKLNAKLNSSAVHENKLEKKIDELRSEAAKFEHMKKVYENAKIEDEKEKQAIIKQHAKYQKEMANISTMLDRRIAELGILYDKVDLKNKMLDRGEKQYQERTNDIRMLKIEVKRLRHQNNILQATYKNMADLRHEIYHLNRDLATERQKCHALQEELETPINFHRWRVLEGTDPEKKDLIDKVQILQKKLLKEVENRALETERFRDLEEVYLQLKKKLINLPGSDIMEELNNTKKALKDKTDENRVFAATLSAREGEIQDYKYRLDKLQQQYNEVKTKIFDEKRIQDYAKMRKFEAAQAAKRSEICEGKTVLGGGFRLEETTAAL